jgi:tetratricopeptide (TPR) repeat protein
VSLVPGHLRWRILNAYSQQGGGLQFYKLDPKRIDRLRRGIVLGEAWGAEGELRMLRWTLFRSLRAADQEVEAQALVESILQSAEPPVKERRPWNFDYVQEYCWILRNQGQPDEALRTVDHWLYVSPGVFRPGQKYLLLERARILAALDRYAEAEQAIDELFRVSTLEELDNTFAPACLARGLLRERRGDVAGALEAWREGSQDLKLDIRAENGINTISRLIMASLGGSMTDEQARAICSSLFSTLAGETTTGYVALIPPSVLREMWRSPRGREWASRIAFRQMSFADQVRIPAVLLVVEMFRQRAFTGASTTPEQDEVAWNLVNQGFSRYMSGELGDPQAVSLAMTWKGVTAFVGWDALAPSLRPEFRGPAAYVFGQRYLRHLNQREQAARFFRTALDDAPADSVLRRLAQEELDQLKAP